MRELPPRVPRGEAVGELRIRMRLHDVGNELEAVQDELGRSRESHSAFSTRGRCAARGPRPLTRRLD